MKKIILMYMVLSGALLTGCSTKTTITWQEEVPLNTGETLLIERSIVWAKTGSYGAPTGGMNPTSDKSLKFSYRGRNYEFTDNLLYGWIAISPSTGLPVIIGNPVYWNWNLDNRYACSVPHYVQMVPDATGKKWSWPTQIEPWLYGLPANILYTYPQFKETRKALYTSADRAARDPSFYFKPHPELARIDPNFSTKDCPSKEFLERNPTINLKKK
jgi:hypothetical protein